MLSGTDDERAEAKRRIAEVRKEMKRAGGRWRASASQGFSAKSMVDLTPHLLTSNDSEAMKQLIVRELEALQSEIQIAAIRKAWSRPRPRAKPLPRPDRVEAEQRRARGLLLLDALRQHCPRQWVEWEMARTDQAVSHDQAVALLRSAWIELRSKLSLGELTATGFHGTFEPVPIGVAAWEVLQWRILEDGLGENRERLDPVASSTVEAKGLRFDVVRVRLPLAQGLETDDDDLERDRGRPEEIPQERIEAEMRRLHANGELERTLAGAARDIKRFLKRELSISAKTGTLQNKMRAMHAQFFPKKKTASPDSKRQTQRGTARKIAKKSAPTAKRQTPRKAARNRARKPVRK
jgi:hypothetical protein